MSPNIPVKLTSETNIILTFVICSSDIVRENHTGRALSLEEALSLPNTVETFPLIDAIIVSLEREEIWLYYGHSFALLCQQVRM